MHTRMRTDLTSHQDTTPCQHLSLPLMIPTSYSGLSCTMCQSLQYSKEEPSSVRSVDTPPPSSPHRIPSNSLLSTSTSPTLSAPKSAIWTSAASPLPLSGPPGTHRGGGGEGADEERKAVRNARNFMSWRRWSEKSFSPHRATHTCTRVQSVFTYMICTHLHSRSVRVHIHWHCANLRLANNIFHG